jgi:hypothetical protein
MNKRIFAFVLMTALLTMTVPIALAAPKGDATRIKDGTLLYSTGHYLEGQPLTLGFDYYGYNYQGHMFKGSFANAYLGRYGFPPYEGQGDDYLTENPTFATAMETDDWYQTLWANRDTQLIMKWNDAWLSNLDRDYDGLLDRYAGYESYDGSGAWLTNHMWGINEDDGSKWEYFVKIITPSTAEGDYVVADGFTLPTDDMTGMWYDADDNEIGYQIWGAFAVIQEFENNYHADYNPDGINHFVWYKSVNPLGFGTYQADPISE